MESGRFVLRIPAGLHKALKELALHEGKSLNSVCLERLAQNSGLLPDLSLEKIISTFQPLGILLFGSVARGEQTAQSDVDLLIVLPHQIPVDRSLYRRWDQLNFNPRYSPQFAHLPRFEEGIGSLWLENAMEGKILYDQGGILDESLRRIRDEIATGVYQKRSSHGQHYWIRKVKDAE